MSASFRKITTRLWPGMASVLGAAIVTSCSELEPPTRAIELLTAHISVDPRVASPDDTIRVRTVFHNPTLRRLVLDVGCGPGYQVFADAAPQFTWLCGAPVNRGIEIPPRDSLVLENIIIAVLRFGPRTYTALSPGKYSVAAGWPVGDAFVQIGEAVPLTILGTDP